MPNFVEIHYWCSTCLGTGLKPTGINGTISCPACGGDGKILRGYVDVDELPKKTEVDAIDAKLDALDAKLDDILAAVAP